jgi:filamentous hemagglutinin family protein
MRKKWQQQLYKFSIATGLAITGLFTNFQQSVFAQLQPDQTLGAESSVVTPIDAVSDRIERGATRGVNLFHSFTDFNIDANRNVYFANPVGIENILTRVTGANPSHILGKLGVEGTANLFLINPHGLIFGENASLDLRGSFISSTASSIQFADGFEFNANGSPITPLLTISVPLGLQYGVNPGKIRVQGDGSGIRTTSELIDTTVGLRVEPNQTLALVGGDIFLEGATLKTAGGRIELGSLGDNSFVSLTPINKGFSLGYEGTSDFKNIQLSQRAAVDASGLGAGDIYIKGKRVTITGGSQIESSTLGAVSGGSLVVNATELLKLIGRNSALGAVVYQNAIGDGGSLTINTNKLLVEDGAQVDTTTFGAGKGGNLIVNATDSIQLIGIGDGFTSGLFASSIGEGDAGNLTIHTSKLLLQDGAQVSTTISGTGKGGNLIVNATDSVQLIGIGNGFTSGLFASSSGEGDAGNLIINTSKLLLQDGAQVSSDTFGAGDAGDLTINTNKLVLQDGSQISSGTRGAGKGGNLTVNATVSIQVIGIDADGFPSGLFTPSEGEGDAGDLTINTNKLVLQDGSQITSGTRGAGDAGDLTINTDQLLVQDGSQVSTGTFSAGKGGNLTVNATDFVQVIGIGTGENAFPSGLFASSNGEGDAGDLTINTDKLLVQDGAGVTTGTFSAGKGGNLIVNATDYVQLIGNSGLSAASGGAMFSNPNTTGNGGNLTINTSKLLVQDGAIVTVNAIGNGNAGNIEINSRSIRLENNATISGNTTSITTNPNQPQATINIRSQDLILRRGSNITTNAQGDNVIGGDINIQTDVLAALNNSDISANSTDFRGGTITIQAQGIFGTEFRDAITPESDITATGANPQLSGTVQIITPDVDPTSGLIDLPTNVIDAESLVGKDICSAEQRAKKSSFTIIGRGGLPAESDELISNSPGLVEWATRSQNQEISSVVQRQQERINHQQANITHRVIQEAQGWIITADGKVILTAAAPNVTPQNSGLNHPNCHVSIGN